jgi:CRP-like cAMP-binding protein
MAKRNRLQAPRADTIELASVLAEHVTYKSGTIIFRQGEPATAVIHLDKGSVRLTVVSHAGKEAVIALLNEERSSCASTRPFTAAFEVSSSLPSFKALYVVRAIVLLVWGALVISSLDNCLQPRLIGRRVGLDELVMFFALLGGLQVFGVLGIVLGQALFAIAASMVDVLTDTNPTGGL